MTDVNAQQVLWNPDQSVVSDSNILRFIAHVEAMHGIQLADYWALDKWAVDQPEAFWNSIWDFGEVIASERGEKVLEHPEKMPGASWYPNARLNYAQNLLRSRDDSPALVFWGEERVKREVSHRQLSDDVSRLAQGLREMGVKPGDRVVGLMPNMPEAVVAALASASIGAVWSSCSPDYGESGVLDRFGQLEPAVMITADAYFYEGKTHDCLAKVAAIEAQLPSLEKVLVVPYVNESPDIGLLRNADLLADFLAPYMANEIVFEQLPFSHPLFIMFSSGTTGVPKCIVHSAGGTLLQHIKEHKLHTDIRPGEHLFYYTTCGWMMWNWLLSGLASGATLCLYDGSPFRLKGDVLFDYADAHDIAVFGTSAKFIEALAKEKRVPSQSHQLKHLRCMLSTGSPLAPESFDYVYENIKQDLQLSSISGGTDIISCFVLGNPTLPVRRGEIQCRGLGMKVEIYDPQGGVVSGEKGELVCSAPFPCMPIGFWNDTDGEKYQRAYFDRFPGIWCHGDYAEITEHNGVIIHGRSDATLNPGGVRIGSAEIYRQVEQVDEVLECVVIGQSWQNDARVVLFVKLRSELVLDEELIARIKKQIRANATPRHVPAVILQVADIPRTKTGKLVELAVRDVVHQRPVVNIEALANPEALEFFRDRPELTSPDQ